MYPKAELITAIKLIALIAEKDSSSASVKRFVFGHNPYPDFIKFERHVAQNIITTLVFHLTYKKDYDGNLLDPDSMTLEIVQHHNIKDYFWAAATSITSIDEILIHLRLHLRYQIKDLKEPSPMAFLTRLPYHYIKLKVFNKEYNDYKVLHNGRLDTFVFSDNSKSIKDHNDMYS